MKAPLLWNDVELKGAYDRMIKAENAERKLPPYSLERDAASEISYMFRREWGQMIEDNNRYLRGFPPCSD